jgi:predicted enzyme related to lactoylglutathione lyase
MNTFRRVELRTTNADGARAFYQSVLGHDRAVIWPLHEQALARGARPHWLGHLDVTDLELTTEQFVARGATPIGPVRPTHDGGRLVVMHDPGGALLAVSALPVDPGSVESGTSSVPVVWHVLNTKDVARAQANYCELFGWALTSRLDLGVHGTFQQFAWQPGGESVGALGDIGGRPGVHPQWLFFFATDSLDAALNATRAAGGVALEPITLPDGTRAGVCGDPQGAAFGLLERVPSAANGG